MKFIFKIFAIIACLALLFSAYFLPRTELILSGPQAESFGQIAVLKGGRAMPLSSASADILRLISGKSTAKIGGKKIDAAQWLLFINAKKGEAFHANFFKTDNRELQNLLGAKGRYFSLNQLSEKYDELLENTQAKDPTPFTNACGEALRNMEFYQIAANVFSLYPNDSSPVEFFEKWSKLAENAQKEVDASVAENRPLNRETLAEAYSYFELLKDLSVYEKDCKSSIIYSINNNGTWLTPLDVLLDPGSPDIGAHNFLPYAKLVEAVKVGDKNAAAKQLQIIEKNNPPSFKLKFEHFFNKLDVFYKGAIFYLLGLLFFALALAFKTKRPELEPAAMVFLIFALLLHLFGICARMFIQERPPVTNFYSSIIFTGAMAVLLGLFFIFKKKNLIFGLAASPLGFLSLLLALNLPYSGDTMGMMSAVLNSNFWLSVHIVPIMLGYCGVFLAGFLASARLLSNAFCLGRYSLASLEENAKSVYAMLCFAMFFSFAGTMLGGVWADLSWGRFWGWDPKENGALMVVLWCALVVHCKILKVCPARVILFLACLGNVIVAWAWFGVNIMGVGLHSYGFVDSGKFWLILFAALQTSAALLAFIPQTKKAKELEAFEQKNGPME